MLIEKQITNTRRIVGPLFLNVRKVVLLRIGCGYAFLSVVMLAASPVRIMRRPPAAINSNGAGAFGASPTVVDSIILAGEAASITTPRKAYPYPILSRTSFWEILKKGFYYGCGICNSFLNVYRTILSIRY